MPEVKEEHSLVTDVVVTIDSASELLQVEGQVLWVLVDSGDAAGDNTLTLMREILVTLPCETGRGALAAVSATFLTQMAFFELVESDSVPRFVC